ncbi:MAG TPA: hypothetical protein VK662_04270 [Acidothermaceae bacterium]|nr:hypothetical protein [Acidothermaceae bacterium]
MRSVRFVKTVMLPETVVGTVDAAAEVAAEPLLAAALDTGATAADVAAEALGAALVADAVDPAVVPLLLLHAATSAPTTSNTPNEVFFTLTISISFRIGAEVPRASPPGIKRFSY